MNVLHTFCLVAAIGFTTFLTVACLSLGCNSGTVNYKSPWFLLTAAAWLGVYLTR